MTINSGRAYRDAIAMELCDNLQQYETGYVSRLVPFRPVNLVQSVQVAASSVAGVISLYSMENRY